MHVLATAACLLAAAAAVSAQSCTSDFCKNSGICLIVAGAPSCACVAGFTGKNCETAEGGAVVSDACKNQPCLNGGSCQPVGDQFKCNCPAGFIGTVCQAAATTAAPGVTTIAPAANCPPAKSDKDNVACNPAEIVFMIEYARGDSYWDVDHEGDFIKRLVDSWRVNDQNIRIGVVTYHDTVSEVIHIDDYKNDPDGLKDRITALTRRLRPSGTNDLAGALDYVKTTAFAGARPGAEKIVIPMVHMMPESTESGIVAAANRLKADCVTVIGIDITGSRAGNWGQGGSRPDADDIVEKTIMEQVVSTPAASHLVEYNDFSALESDAGSWNDDCA